MFTKKSFLLFFLCFSVFSLLAQPTLEVGAERISDYLPLLKGKRVGMVVNPTSILPEKNVHIVDTLQQLGIEIVRVFAPEHGFRGGVDAGEDVEDGIDTKTKIPVVSLYGKKIKPSDEDMQEIDVMLFDIQDVGTRFYTYISTLQYVMEVCADFGTPLILLDRPNPNGHYVDGAVLDTAVRSFVGLQPVPTVYGMTIGEYATMLNGERWLEKGKKCNLKVVKCSNYNHRYFYSLPVRPSPNLPNMRAIYLYPSLCFFEGVNVSVGRGTEQQFQVYGSPYMPPTGFAFVPMPNEGAKKPMFEAQNVNAYDLTGLKINVLRKRKTLNMNYLINAYQKFSIKDSFFLKDTLTPNFFDKLAGTTQLRQQIKEGKTEEEIRQSWQPALRKFKKIRRKYLLYKDF